MHRLHFDVVDFVVTFKIDIHTDAFRLGEQIHFFLGFQIQHFGDFYSHQHFQEQFAKVLVFHNLAEQVIIRQRYVFPGFHVYTSSIIVGTKDVFSAESEKKVAIF